MVLDMTISMTGKADMFENHLNVRHVSRVLKSSLHQFKLSLQKKAFEDSVRHDLIFVGKKAKYFCRAALETWTQASS